MDDLFPILLRAKNFRADGGPSCACAEECERSSRRHFIPRKNEYCAQNHDAAILGRAGSARMQVAGETPSRFEIVRQEAPDSRFTFGKILAPNRTVA
jgi:hypothetical protein